MATEINWLIVQPSFWMAVFFLTAWFLSFRFRRLSIVSLALALLALLFHMPSVAVSFKHTLFWVTPDQPEHCHLAPPKTALVLTGGVERYAGQEFDLNGPSQHRALGLTHLMATQEIEKIILSGGQVRRDLTTESVEMREFLVRRGVEGDLIQIESQSRTTFENLKHSQQQFNLQRAWLVTSDIHMPRAALTAKSLGLDLCQFSVVDFMARRNAPSWHGAMVTSRVLHEWIGIIWYWLSGRI
mgnify:FL=1